MTHQMNGQLLQKALEMLAEVVSPLKKEETVLERPSDGDLLYYDNASMMEKLKVSERTLQRYRKNGKIRHTTFGGKNWVPNRIVDHQELYKIINSGFNSPILRRPCVVLEEANKAVLYKDRDTSVFNISYVYLRKPLEMSLDATSNNVPTGKTNECELDESTHMDIVNNAVQMFITDYKYKLTTRQ